MRGLKVKASISYVEQILKFSDERILESALAIKKEYLALTYRKLMEMVEEAIETGGQQYSVIKSILNEMDEKELDAFLFIPELANQIYRRKEMTLVQKANYIIRILEGEFARKEKVVDAERYQELWTANGSHLYQYDSESKEFSEYEAPLLFDEVVLDFFSPYNRMLSNVDCNIPNNFEVGMYSFEEAAAIADRLRACLQKADPVIQQFIKHFSAVILFKKVDGEVDDGKVLFSATDGAFVSRIILGNVENFYDEELMDAMVHESIHGLLFMIDELGQWMPNTKISDEIGRIIASPWTGNKLTLRNVLQAVFVWYGLFHFWKGHEKTFDSSFAEERMENIKAGFENLNIKVYGKEVPQETLETIAAAKQSVLTKDE